MAGRQGMSERRKCKSQTKYYGVGIGKTVWPRCGGTSKPMKLMILSKQSQLKNHNYNNVVAVELTLAAPDMMSVTHTAQTYLRI